MRHAGLVEFRRHDPDIVGERMRDLFDHLQAGGMNAIVIGAENSHPAKTLVPSNPQKAFKAPSYPLIEVEANASISLKNAGIIDEIPGPDCCFCMALQTN